MALMVILITLPTTKTMAITGLPIIMKIMEAISHQIIVFVDPFGGAKPCLLRQGKKALLRVNPEQAQAFRPGSRRVDL
jgi:hypothetical protein